MARRITNVTKHAHQILDGLVLPPGDSLVLTDKQEAALSTDDYYAALVMKEIIREDEIQAKPKRVDAVAPKG